MKRLSIPVLLVAVAGCGSPPDGPILVSDRSVSSQLAVSSDRSANPMVLGGKSMYKRPPVEQTVRGGSFARGGAKASVAGVCSYTENSVSCWSPTGKPLPDLAKEVTAKMEALKTAVPYREDLLNRIFVMDTEGDANGSLYVDAIEDIMVRQSFTMSPNKFNPKRPQWNRTARFFFAKRDQDKFGVVTTYTTTVKGNFNIRLKVGATGSKDGYTAKILSIKESRAVRLKGHTGYRLQVEIKGMKADDRASVGPHLKPSPVQIEYSKTSMYPWGYFAVESKKGNVYTIAGEADKAKLLGIYFGFNQQHRIRLGGLPINP